MTPDYTEQPLVTHCLTIWPCFIGGCACRSTNDIRVPQKGNPGVDRNYENHNAASRVINRTMSLLVTETAAIITAHEFHCFP